MRKSTILLDIKLPGIDGREVLRRLRRNPHTRRQMHLYWLVLNVASPSWRKAR